MKRRQFTCKCGFEDCKYSEEVYKNKEDELRRQQELTATEESEILNNLTKIELFLYSIFFF